MYQVETDYDGVKRLNEDGTISWIPEDEHNCDWCNYKKWLDEGNLPYADNDNI